MKDRFSESLWARTDTPSKWHRFMFHDWANPSRYLAFYLVSDHYWKKERKYRFAEIGFGDAWDFRFGWKQMHDKGYIDYTGYEITANFALYAAVEFPNYNFQQGGFLDLERDAYDITYTRHTFEHIEPMLWRKCLARLLRATKELCIITWYMPPGHGKAMRKNWKDWGDYGSWQNRYHRPDVLKVIDGLGWCPTFWEVGTNEVWALEK